VIYPDPINSSPHQSCEPDVENVKDAVVNKRVLVVVVLYKKLFEDIPCAARIKSWLSNVGELRTELHLVHCLVYDNGPDPLPTGFGGHLRTAYVHNPRNGGTRAAYMAATEMALAHGCDWVLFLDHDTDLPADFFSVSSHALTQSDSDRPIAAVIPHVYDGAMQVSPSLVTSYGRVSQYPVSEKKGSRDGYQALTAIASASLVQTRCLSSLLPIPAVFSLDYLDHWLFREIQLRGGRLKVSSAKIEHSLSVCSMKSMDVGRYRAILDAELLFLQGDATYSRVTHGLWHLLRTVKLALLTRRLPLLLVCWQAARKIIWAT
jgi:glycosyltransferase involved in cell wall biosynthesis